MSQELAQGLAHLCSICCQLDSLMKMHSATALFRLQGLRRRLSYVWNQGATCWLHVVSLVVFHTPGIFLHLGSLSSRIAQAILHGSGYQTKEKKKDVKLCL